MFAALALLGGCGGGVESDDNGSATRLTCPKTCTPSNTVATDQIRASYVMVSDGTRLQAQAGFSTGSDPRFNVELAGGDQLQLATPVGVQGFHIPAGSISTLLVDALQVLLAGAKPYLSEVTPLPTAVTTYEFRFTRGSDTFAAPVQLPAPFTILQPAAGATVSIAAPELTVRTSAGGSFSHGGTIRCTDVNGNTAGPASVSPPIKSTASNTAAGAEYTLDLATALNGLQFTTDHPRGAVASCDLTLIITSQNNGTPHAKFHTNSRVFAQQIRQVAVMLR